MEHIQLTWRNWNKICEFVSEDIFIEGTYLDSNNKVSELNKDFTKIGLFLNINNIKCLATTNDYIVKENNKIKILSELQFIRRQKLENLKWVK